MDLVVFVGLPGSGKTTYYLANFASTHVHVSKDLMKGAAAARQEKQIDSALREGKSVVVDNTNPTVVVRQPLIALGRRHGARLIAYYFEIEAKEAAARNRKREGKARVPDVAIYATKSKLKPPTKEEGFDEVHVIRTGSPSPQLDLKM